MALADIRKKIEQNAADEAARLLGAAKEQAAALNSSTDAEISKSKKYYDGLYEAEAPEVRRRAQIVANLDVNRIKLGAKQELIGKTFEGALSNLAALPADKYLAFVETLLDQAVISGDEELVVAPGEKFVNQAFIDKYNAAKGKNLTIAADTRKMSGGFILRSGKISTNCSFDKLINWLKDDLESDVTARLFGAE